MYGGCQPPPPAVPNGRCGSLCGGLPAPLAVRKGRCASPPRRHPSTPLLTGLPPRFFRHWRRSAPPPRPAFKKAGENWLESFLGFPTAYAGPPLTGSGGLVLWVGFRGGKRLANGSLGLRKIPASPGGRRRAQSALKERRPGPPLFCLAAGAALRAAPACQTPPPPPGTLGFSPTPKKGRATAWLWVIPAPPAAKETVVAARAVAGQPCPNNSNPLVAGPSPPG